MRQTLSETVIKKETKLMADSGRLTGNPETSPSNRFDHWSNKPPKLGGTRLDYPAVRPGRVEEWRHEDHGAETKLLAPRIAP